MARERLIFLACSLLRCYDKQMLDYWETDECNSLKDVRAPGMFPIEMDKADALRIFIGGLCRTIEFKYKKEASSSSQRAQWYETPGMN